jgi:hypothetical protein
MKNYQKSLISVLLFLVIFFGIYFLLSLMGVVFGNTYKESAGCVGWFFIYSMFGTPLAGVISHEAYEEL